MAAGSETLSGTLAECAARGDERWARIVEDDRTVSVAELDHAATATASVLARRGVRAGLRVGVVVRNDAAHVAALFAVWRLGAVAVPLNPRLLESEREALLAHAGAVACVDGSEEDGSAAVRRGPSPSTGAVAGSSDEAVIAYTSGTTGRPKGVVLTHANMLAAARAVARTRGDHAGSVALVVSPLSHNPVFVSHYLARLLCGGTILLGAFDPERIARVVRRWGVTDLPLVPAMVGPLLDADLAGPTSLAKVTIGSALTPMAVKEALAARFAGAQILEAYGQTESTDGLTMTTGREALDRPGTVGRAHAGLAVAIRGPDGALLPAGAPGEIVARGPCVMRGYLDDPDATARALRDGWLHTGDLGRLDEDGFLYITGRLKEIIITGGENVSPDEVEAVLARHPEVVEAAVFGTPHERWGEQVTVAVVARVDLTVEELRAFARPHLAAFKLPRVLVRVDELPRTSAGKVRRGALRERFTGAG